MATGWGSVLSDQQRYSYATDGVVPWVTATGRLFTSRYMWRTEPIVNHFVFNSGVGELAAALMVRPLPLAALWFTIVL